MPVSPSAFHLAHPRQLFIGGAWIEPASTATVDIRNAATEEVVGTVPMANQEDVRRAVAAARTAFDTGPWPRMPHAERAQYLRAIALACERRADEFARVWSTESGILYRLSQARIGRLMSGAFNYYADLVKTFHFQERHRSSGGLLAQIVREPVGVVAAIIPWNGPAGLLAYKCAPALVAGCSVVLKSSPEAPCSSYLMAEICQEVGLPPGVFNILTADREVSETLVRNPGVDKVTFTGSTAAGRKIASVCGERIARYTLELGGKSPALVLDDYEITAAAKNIASGVGYVTGQVCHSLTRVIVPKWRHDAMVEALSAAVSGMNVGDPFDPASDVGPLATSQQRDRVEGYIAKGKAEGARLATGGGRPKHLPRGFFIEPTIFGNVDNRSTIGREEIFGPVLCVIAANDEQHAIDLANDTIYGLNASVYTHDLDRFYSTARRLHTGTVGHNASRTDFTVAFGGVKQSGVGREGGVDGLLPFLEAKTIVADTPYVN
jgi:aldehyde dehydrogenase (NAD+)